MARKKYSRTTVPRYMYKQYIYRSYGGIVPKDMAEAVTKAQTSQWEEAFNKVRKLREAVRAVLIQRGVPSSQFGMYYALALSLAKMIKKMKEAGVPRDSYAEVAIEYSTNFASSKGLNQEIVGVINSIVLRYA